MHPKQRQELRSQIRRLIYYAEQLNVPRSEMVEAIERKIRIQITPDTTESEYFAFEA